jgi:hypothetical protein
MEIKAVEAGIITEKVPTVWILGVRWFIPPVIGGTISVK